MKIILYVEFLLNKVMKFENYNLMKMCHISYDKVTGTEAVTEVNGRGSIITINSVIIEAV